MSQHDHGDLPDDLGRVADELRTHRYEATELELDQLKTRLMKRTNRGRAAKGGGMRIRTLVTAAIMFVAIGTGSAAALSSASTSMYGRGLTLVTIRCNPGLVGAGQSTTCTVTVTGVLPPFTPTGVITFTSTAGGGFSPTFCTLQPGRPTWVSTCTTSYTPAGSGLVFAHYSGDATFAPNDSLVPFRVLVR